MIRKTITGVFAATVVSVFAPSLALAAPGIPHQFYGSATFESGTAPDGLMVEAKVNGAVVGVSTTKSGKYGINPDLLMLSKADGEWAGESAKFYVAGIDTGETYSLARGGYTSLNLTVPGSVGVISKSATDTVSDTTVAVTPTTPASVTMGDALTVNINASGSTSATIEKIEQLSSGFFTGATAVLSGNSVLNAYEIKITGTGLSISVVMHYSDTGIDETSIKPYRFDGSSWVAITPFTRDSSANTITFSVAAAATPYSIFGAPAVVATPVASSSGGGGGGTTIVSSTAKPGDTNNDGKIDILDFNLLMVRWGIPASTGATQGDFNSDGKVDIFDFNSLMVVWTTTL